jgi:hypothetical protein
MILPINPPKQVIVAPAIPAQSVEASELTIVTISDNTVDCVTAVVTIDTYDLVLILWEGPAYIAIGNWTQEQANARILELI